MASNSTPYLDYSSEEVLHLASPPVLCGHATDDEDKTSTRSANPSLHLATSMRSTATVRMFDNDLCLGNGTCDRTRATTDMCPTRGPHSSEALSSSAALVGLRQQFTKQNNTSTPPQPNSVRHGASQYSCASNKSQGDLWPTPTVRSVSELSLRSAKVTAPMPFEHTSDPTFCGARGGGGVYG